LDSARDRRHGRPGGREQPVGDTDDIGYTIHMKRTNLVLNGELLERATQTLGVKTYSATVNLALEEVLRMRKIQGLTGFFGTSLWRGDLAEMREDRPRTRSPRGTGRKRGRR
jgi:Arc/MetJ family transcription regulator